MSCPPSETYQLPDELMAEFYVGAIQMVLGWCFLRKEHMGKGEALDALRYLFGGVR